MQTQVVDVAVEQPPSVVAGPVFDVAGFGSGVAPIWEVVESYHRAVVEGECGFVLDGGEQLDVEGSCGAADLSVSAPYAVVVACDEVFCAVAFGYARQGQDDFAEGDVSENPHFVAGVDVLIPSCDEVVVHFFGGAVGALAVADDVVVAEV